ncbi:MAG TPA: DUF6600 domain-containing protein [Bryobacteraceae bacterium]|jgi:hypothetical protein|nr:DUF6600 domain-containing protein [Bryobacteraceae bacterium]
MRRLFLALSFACLAMAQEAADPPSRAARLSYINGTVSFQPGGVDDWVPAEPNRPLTTGDRLWTEEGSRAELNFGSAAFRLNSRTNFTFLNLDDKAAQIQLSLGTLSIRLRRLADDETIEIDTPQAAFPLLRPGDYRIDVNEAGDATIATVRGGDAEATASGQSFPIHAREQVRITGVEGTEPVFDRRPAPPTDPFDNFCQDRDRREDLSTSGKYVSRDIPGYADLDANGTWRTDPQYGAVWVPSTVPVGWSPYRYGHWAWIAPWGWTWVDDAPWGYAPFHYGRWAFVAGSWVWVPGPIGPRPVYAPAMVAYVGGAGFGVGVVGWFPLGPREVFVPAYGVSAVYMTRVNVTNTVVTEVAVRNVYANRAVPGAVVAVRGEAIVGGRPIAAEAVRVPPAAIERAEVIRAAPVAPERAAVLGGRAPLAGPHLPPAAVVNRPVVSRITPPAAVHVNVRPANVPVNAAPSVNRVEAAPPNNRPNATPAAASTPRPETASSSHEERAPQKKTSKPAKKTTRSEKDR